jgi:hypothetical protein
MNAGIGVMLGYLGGNEETVNAIKSSIGKTIEKVELIENRLEFTLNDSVLSLWDDGQSCCEYRYMVTDDNLKEFEGAILKGFEIKEAPSVEDEYGEHEVQFLEVTTNKGSFVMSNHNEHNGYYGGFWIVATVKQK